MIDLHIHSTFSDGTFTPSEIILEAEKRELKAIALTDHDTVGGNNEFLETGKSFEVITIAGVEISAEFSHPEKSLNKNGEMHILGFFPDWNDKTEDAMSPLAEIRQNREIRNPLIIKKLQELGCNITYKEVQDFANNDVVGRPHIAAVLEKKGYVRNFKDAFDKYLAKDAPAFVAKQIFSPEVAISLINNAGGISVLAHPGSLRISNEGKLRWFLEYLIGCGIKGIEAYCVSESETETQKYLRLASDYNLIVTGGTDFHGSHKPDIKLGTGFGGLKIPDSCLDNLKIKI